MKVRIPKGMNLPPRWQYAKRYPHVINGIVKEIPWALAVRQVRTSGWCVTEHEDGPVQAEPRSWLCWRCREDVTRALLGIERAWPALQDLLYPSRAGGEVGGKSVDPAVPVALEFVDVTAKVEAAVVGLASQFLEDRPDLQMAPSATTGQVAGRMGRWHMDWLLGHPNPRMVADVVVEVWEAWLEVPGVAAKAEVVPKGEGWVSRARARPAAAPAAWVDVLMVMEMTGWSRSYVGKRASLDRWRTAGTKPQQYRLDDVLASCPAGADTPSPPGGVGHRAGA